MGIIRYCPAPRKARTSHPRHVPRARQHTHAATGLQALNLRQNLLTDVGAWDQCQCKGALEDLEFRDNQLKEVGQTRSPAAVNAAPYLKRMHRPPRPCSAATHAQAPANPMLLSARALAKLRSWQRPTPVCRRTHVCVHPPIQHTCPCMPPACSDPSAHRLFQAAAAGVFVQ